MNSKLIADLSRRLGAIARGRWSELHFEYQDSGKFLLVSVESRAEGAELEAVRADLRAVLKGAMPDREDDYSWSAVVKRDGVVVDSLMGGCSGSLPEL